ncbi:MAG: tRNA (adenosine(37)-N6)-dimethylallyltransferase MiaA [Candidatus Microsaccharimonas sp.]
MATPVKNGMNKKSIQELDHLNLPLIVILGPTASGKSAIAMRVAKQLNGEIICADSRTIYKHMDIGTAKPSKQDQAEIPHWGIDLVEPGEVFTAADFKNYATKKISEIRSRGHVPLLVGGSGLYIDGVIFDYQFAKPNPTMRAKLEAMTLNELKQYCSSHNIKLPKNENNRRYVIRTIEKQGKTVNRGEKPISNTIIVGITTSTEELKHRIGLRSEQLFETGMVDEAKKLGEKYGWDSEAMTGNIYKIVKQYLDGTIDFDELKRRNETADWHLAKKQLTWFKRNPYITWKPLNEAYEYIIGSVTSL